MLFVANPVLSHVLPLVPLAWAGRTTGNDVLFATAGVTEHVRQAGLPVADLLPGFAVEEWEEQLHRRYPDVQGLGALRAHGMKFAALNDTLARPLAELAEAWRPDLVVYSEITPIGAVAAARRGVPSVRHDIEICDTSSMLGHLADVLAGAFGHDLPPQARAPERIVTAVPPALATGKPRDLAMRHMPYSGGFVLPCRQAPSPRPRLVVTGGTSTQDDRIGRLGRILRAAGQVDADVVLAMPPEAAKAYEPLPPNVEAAGWVPLPRLLPGASALVHHGGAGTVMSAVAAGVPQLVLPDELPRHLNAQAVTRQGAAITARPEDVDAALLRRLVEDPALRAGAERLAAECAALPPPAEVAGTLAIWAQAGRGG
ncbi:glycosyltransferase [Thermocatellispora tengchongensis]|nr:glycosyltransferase [Thermocatellispora tengchongensis]